MTTATGFLHPGAMGATIAAECGGERWWASHGRSGETRLRAEAAGLLDAVSVEALVERVDTIVSVCPPASASELARSVAAIGFSGVFIDANAISPDRARSIGELFDRFVDGGIIGPPATRSGTTRMYLSGHDASYVAERWANSNLEVRPMGSDVGAASALKMAYAAWTKGKSALLLAVNALADCYGVGEALDAEWAISQPTLGELSEKTASAVAPKAWRFEGEMLEIASTFDAVGLPSGFHEAAAELYHQLAGLKHESSPELSHVLEALRAPDF